MENYKKERIVGKSMLTVAMINIIVLLIIAIIITYGTEEYRYHMIYGWIILLAPILRMTITRYEKKEENIENKILLFLKEIVNDSTTMEISRNLKENQRNISRSIKYLLSEGKIEENPVNNSNYTGKTYKLVNI